VRVRFKQPRDETLPSNLPSALPTAPEKAILSLSLSLSLSVSLFLPFSLPLSSDGSFHPKNARVIRAERPETLITKLKKSRGSVRERERERERVGKSPRDISCFEPNNGSFLRAISTAFPRAIFICPPPERR